MGKLNIFIIAIIGFLFCQVIFLPIITSSTLIINKQCGRTGVILYEDGCCEGYTLCYFYTNKPDDTPRNILIDMEGKIIKTWPNTTAFPAKILPGGSIITGTGGTYQWDVYNLTQIDWNGNIEWNFCNWCEDFGGKNSSRQHHDFQREGNPVGYYAPGQEFVSDGKTLVLSHNTVYNLSISRKEFIDDVIYEVNWDGSLTGFEWHAINHIDEMGFNLKSRIGIWFNPGGPDKPLTFAPYNWWLHLNTISYLGENKWYPDDERFNPENILICSRIANFIAIISKESGDIIWRIGPDFSKNTEEGSKIGQIIGPHYAHIIPEGLPGAGNILLFDNGGLAEYGLFGCPSKLRLYSRVIEINPKTLDIVWEYSHKKGFYPLPRSGEYHKFFSPTGSSAQRLPNGNTLITECLTGHIFEITADKEILWEYLSPELNLGIYRGYRIPPEWIPGNPSNYTFWE